MFTAIALVQTVPNEEQPKMRTTTSQDEWLKGRSALVRRLPSSCSRVLCRMPRFSVQTDLDHCPNISSEPYLFHLSEKLHSLSSSSSSRSLDLSKRTLLMRCTLEVNTLCVYCKQLAESMFLGKRMSYACVLIYLIYLMNGQKEGVLRTIYKTSFLIVYEKGRNF